MAVSIVTPRRFASRRLDGTLPSRPHPRYGPTMSTPEPPTDLQAILSRIADALDRIAPKRGIAPDFDASDAFVWHAEDKRFAPVAKVNRVAMPLLKGIDLV